MPFKHPKQPMAAVQTTRPSRCASCKWRPRRSMVLSSRAKAPRDPTKLDDLMSQFFFANWVLYMSVNHLNDILCRLYQLHWLPGVLHFLRNDFNGFLDVAKPMRISGSPFMVRRSSSLVEGGGPDLWKSDPQRQSYLDFLVIRSDWRIWSCFFLSWMIRLSEFIPSRPHKCEALAIAEIWQLRLSFLLGCESW